MQNFSITLTDSLGRPVFSALAEYTTGKVPKVIQRGYETFILKSEVNRVCIYECTTPFYIKAD